MKRSIKIIRIYFILCALAFCLVVPKEVLHCVFFENADHHETIHRRSSNTAPNDKRTVVEKAHTHCDFLNFEFTAAFISIFFCGVVVASLAFINHNWVFNQPFSQFLGFFRGRAPPLFA
jgi:hypothetical protein